MPNQPRGKNRGARNARERIAYWLKRQQFLARKITGGEARHGLDKLSPSRVTLRSQKHLVERWRRLREAAVALKDTHTAFKQFSATLEKQNLPNHPTIAGTENGLHVALARKLSNYREPSKFVELRDGTALAELGLYSNGVKFADAKATKEGKQLIVTLRPMSISRLDANLHEMPAETGTTLFPIHVEHNMLEAAHNYQLNLDKYAQLKRAYAKKYCSKK